MAPLRPPSLSRPLWLAAAIAAGYWLLESALHAYVWHSGAFYDTLLSKYDPNELWMRLVIVTLLLGFGAYMQRTMGKEVRLRAQAERLNRLLRFLSEVNQRVQRQRNADDMFDAVCRAAVKLGGFCFAWVGRIGPNGTGLMPMARAAHSEDCLKAVEDAGVEPLVPCSIAAQAVREGRPQFCQILSSIDCQAAWRQPLLNHGAKSAAAFPIRRGETIIGALGVYAGDSGFFHEEEIHILEEAADDISFALTAIAHEKERKASQEALEQRVEELERFRKATVQREFRIKELRDEIAALKARIEGNE